MCSIFQHECFNGPRRRKQRREKVGIEDPASIVSASISRKAKSILEKGKKRQAEVGTCGVEIFSDHSRKRLLAIY